MRGYDHSDVRALRRLFDGAGPASAVGVAVLALGTILLVVVLTSPGAWQWFGAKSVTGLESGGVVEYHYRGQSYSLDDVTAVSGSASRPRTVYLNPADPGQASFGITVAQVSDSLFVGFPYLLGVLFVAYGFGRRRRIRRRSREWDEYGPIRPFGSGIDSETIRRLTGRRENPPLKP